MRRAVLTLRCPWARRIPAPRVEVLFPDGRAKRACLSEQWVEIELVARATVLPRALAAPPIGPWMKNAVLDGLVYFAIIGREPVHVLLIYLDREGR